MKSSLCLKRYLNKFSVLVLLSCFALSSGRRHERKMDLDGNRQCRFWKRPLVHFRWQYHGLYEVPFLFGSDNSAHEGEKRKEQYTCYRTATPKTRKQASGACWQVSLSNHLSLLPIFQNCAYYPKQLLNIRHFFLYRLPISLILYTLGMSSSLTRSPFLSACVPVHVYANKYSLTLWRATQLPANTLSGDCRSLFLKLSFIRWFWSINEAVGEKTSGTQTQ